MALLLTGGLYAAATMVNQAQRSNVPDGYSAEQVEEGVDGDRFGIRRRTTGAFQWRRSTAVYGGVAISISGSEQVEVGQPAVFTAEVDSVNAWGRFPQVPTSLMSRRPS